MKKRKEVITIYRNALTTYLKIRGKYIDFPHTYVHYIGERRLSKDVGRSHQDYSATKLPKDARYTGGKYYFTYEG